ncbi:hypothetical protein J2T57_002616 [Natronocella acetinitrilica]|uniref:Alpha/beta hydrolase n=1 Tax=Natronocella acetinitrilica TaxID=414046 RepID=A0AAE3G467_9GAMM|nr:alpha/beta hydrolase [Natronocella acetinitrilica]MCP1675466.1 hypothetical protein [Natronocella acetinitrilica]
MSVPVVLIPGIRAWHRGERQLGGLRDALRWHGLDAHIAGYSILLPLSNRTAINTVMAVVDALGGPVDLVGFSNGGVTAIQVAELGAPVRNLHLISVPLNGRHEIPGQVQKATVYHDRSDRAITAGRCYGAVTRLAPWRWRRPHLYWRADMGRHGYQGDDPRVRNVELRGVGHAWYDHADKVSRIASRIARQHAATTQPLEATA